MAQYSLLRPWAADPWGEIDQLRRDMDALFTRYGRGSARSGRRGAFPAVNLYETADAYVLTAELPGVATSDIEITLEGSTITLHGQRKFEYTSDEETSVHRLERESGRFRRAFEMPAELDADKIEAVHKNGILMLRMPKVPEAQPRQIAVKAS